MLIRDKKKNISSIWGDEDFKTRSHARAQRLDMEIDKKGLKEPIPMETIIQEVAKHYNLQVEKITTTKRGQGQKEIPRWIAMKLCQDVGSAKLTEIARVINVGHYSTVSQRIKRLKVLMDRDDEVFTKVNMLSQDLTPTAPTAYWVVISIPKSTV